MSAAEKIGGVELSTYGLRLARMDGNFDLPAFKQVLDEHGFESNLLVLDEKNIKIRLIGIYSSREEMGTALNNFFTKIESALKLEWIFLNHEIQADFVVKNGIQSNIYSTAAELILTLTMT
ncbi:MAG TPA: hypothetical protein DHV48_03630 [Prolixibacteraceae bacterium]|nr:hypothetical protein [Prolixibacteraceae bacterium]